MKKHGKLHENAQIQNKSQSRMNLYLKSKSTVTVRLSVHNDDTLSVEIPFL